MGVSLLIVACVLHFTDGIYLYSYTHSYPILPSRKNTKNKRNIFSCSYSHQQAAVQLQLRLLHSRCSRHRFLCLIHSGSHLKTQIHPTSSRRGHLVTTVWVSVCRLMSMDCERHSCSWSGLGWTRCWSSCWQLRGFSQHSWTDGTSRIQTEIW